MALHYAPYTRSELDAIISRQESDREAWADDSMTCCVPTEVIDDDDDETYADKSAYVNVYATGTNVLVRSHFVAQQDAESVSEALREDYPAPAFQINIEN